MSSKEGKKPTPQQAKRLIMIQLSQIATQIVKETEALPIAKYLHDKLSMTLGAYDQTIKDYMQTVEEEVSRQTIEINGLKEELAKRPKEKPSKQPS